MANPPVPTPIFHITAIDNLASIGRSGALISNTAVAQRRIKATSIAYANLQSRRANLTVPIPPGGSLHDYVPFMFAPRSPMLFTINEGNVPSCPHRQDDIVHIVSNAQIVRDNDLRFVFTNYHAIMGFAHFYGDLEDLSEIDWPLFFEEPREAGYCKYWHDRHSVARYARRRETRQAEFLVRDEVPLDAILEIGVRTADGQRRVEAALEGTGWRPTVRVVRGWYY